VLAAEPSGQRPLLYLRGAASGVLEALVAFLYTGRAEVEQDLLQQFMALGEDLGVDGLVKDVEADSGGGGDNITEDFDQQVSVEKEPKQAMKLEPIGIKHEKLTKLQNSGTRVLYQVPESTKLQTSERHLVSKGKRTKFRANDQKIILPFRANDKKMIFRHKRSLDGTFDCPFCETKMKDKSNIRKHIQRHQNIDFPCTKCDYIARAQSNLKSHMKRNHEDNITEEKEAEQA
jgi:hypothetical protein